jgi:hypothetical protein
LDLQAHKALEVPRVLLARWVPLVRLDLKVLAEVRDLSVLLVILARLVLLDLLVLEVGLVHVAPLDLQAHKALEADKDLVDLREQLVLLDLLVRLVRYLQFQQLAQVTSLQPLAALLKLLSLKASRQHHQISLLSLLLSQLPAIVRFG